MSAEGNEVTKIPPPASTMKRNILPLRARRSGFTLAEVMIAMGIVASVMVGLLGMTTMSVRSIRESSNLAIQGRIAQEVINNIQMADWSDIEVNFKNKSFYFDNEGFPVSQAKGAGGGAGGQGEKPSFEARVRLEDKLVKVGKTEFQQSSVRKVTVEVEFTPGGVKVMNVKARQQGNLVGYFTFYVANQNKRGVKG